MAKPHPRYADMEFPDWEFVEFPMMVYPGAPDQKKPYDAAGRPLKGVIVNSREEALQALGGDPMAPKAKTVATEAAGVSRLKTPADEKKEALERARLLGVPNIDKRWNLATIEAAIAEFEHAQSAGDPEHADDEGGGAEDDEGEAVG